MVKLLNESEKNQSARTHSDYIVLKTGYNDKLILPFSEGIAMLKSFSSCYEIEEGYNKPTKTHKWRKEITISFMNQQDLNEALLLQTLEDTDDDG